MAVEPKDSTRGGDTYLLAPSFPGLPAATYVLEQLLDPGLLAGATVPPSGGGQSDPQCHGGDPSLEEVLLEAGVAVQHQPEPDSASHLWPLNPASEPLGRGFFQPTLKELRKTLDHS